MHLGIYKNYQSFRPLIFYGYARLRGVGADKPPPLGQIGFRWNPLFLVVSLLLADFWEIIWPLLYINIRDRVERLWFSRFSVNLSCFALSFWLSFQSPAQRKGQKICNYFPTAADTSGLYEVHLIIHHLWIKDIQTVPIWLDWLDELISQEKKPQAQFLSTERGSVDMTVLAILLRK